MALLSPLRLYRLSIDSLSSQAAIHQRYDQHYEQDQSKPAARIVAPAATIWPCRKSPECQYQQND